MGTDVVKETMIRQGYVPKNCTLDGNLVWMIINKSEDPCAGCNENRTVCGGRPRMQDEIAKKPVDVSEKFDAVYMPEQKAVILKRKG